MARATTSRGASSASGCTLEHEALAGAVDQLRALAAQRLGGERRRIAADVERGRVELHELRVGDHRAGARRHAEAVAFRLRRVGGDGVEMADAAGGEHDRARPGTGPAAPPSRGRATMPATRPPRVTQRSRRRSPRACGSTACCRTASTSAAMIAAPAMSPLHVDDAPLGMRRLARHARDGPQGRGRRARRSRGGRGCAPARRATISRAIFSSTMPAPAAIVSATCFSTESPGAMAAAMPPCAQAEEAPSPIGARGEHGHRPRREAQRAEQAGQAAADDDDVVGDERVGVERSIGMPIVRPRSGEVDRGVDGSPAMREPRLSSSG